MRAMRAGGDEGRRCGGKRCGGAAVLPLVAWCCGGSRRGDMMRVLVRARALIAPSSRPSPGLGLGQGSGPHP